MNAEPDGLEPWRRVGLVATLALVLSWPLSLALRPSSSPRASSSPARARYVGSQACAECHQGEHEAWKGSNHAHSMLAARPDSVLGDFDNREFRDRGRTWRFTRRDGRYYAWTDDLAGAPAEFQVLYTFGWYPLQQYLVAFPGGRLQCLSAAWDVPGRRWFHLSPDREVPPSDWLHWTRASLNWNTMCSQCHSTGVHKRYDPKSDTFRTSWAEITVGCEACHGPGSLHQDWARQPAMGRPQAPNAALTVKTHGLTQGEEVQFCAACHSRRAEIEDIQAPTTQLLDTHLPSLLDEGLFFPDGQILDEDYEYHSFTQSRMYEKGVRCSDCHDVHQARRRRSGNQLCLECHRADTYDGPGHHFHQKSYQGRPSKGSECISCHMPGRNYMVVHFRRDHSLRIPRPDLTATLGVPNSCSASGCHADKPLPWLQERYDQWHGRTRKPHYGTVLAAARRRAPEARGGLQVLALDRLRPNLARATAMDLLDSYPGEDSAKVLRQGLADPDPLVRRTAASRFQDRDPASLVEALAPLLKDPVRAVRMEAAVRLAGLPLSETQQMACQEALAEYRAFLDFSADLPSGRYNRASLEERLGNLLEADRQYRKALEMDDGFYLAAVNLAVLVDAQGRPQEAEALLRQALKANPQDGSVWFNLGLVLAELGRRTEAEAALRQALEHSRRLAPAAYNLAVLVGERHPREAADLCGRALAVEPRNGRYAFTRAFFQARAGQGPSAIRTLETLLKVQPTHEDAILLLGELREKAGQPDLAARVYAQALEQPGLRAEVRRTVAARLAGLRAP